MSNNPRNKEQNQLIALTPQQQDPARALPTDFEVNSNSEVPAVPLHAQHGRTEAERRRLMTEGHEHQPLPERNRIPPRRMKS